MIASFLPLILWHIFIKKASLSPPYTTKKALLKDLFCLLSSLPFQIQTQKKPADTRRLGASTRAVLIVR
jgi:hypothetical protein